MRTRAGLTQRQLAERAGVTHGLISMLEANKNSPSVASLRKILGGIPMTMVEFFEPERPASAQVFFRPEDLADLTGRVGHAHGNGASGTMSFRQVGDPRAHNLQILHERYAPGADTGERSRSTHSTSTRPSRNAGSFRTCRRNATFVRRPRIANCDNAEHARAMAVSRVSATAMTFASIGS